MRLNISCIFTLILCGICISEAYKIGKETSKTETKLTDLNSDVLFLIFINLNLQDLIHLTKINQPLALSAVDAFQHTYRGYKIKLIKPEFNSVYSNLPAVQESYEKVFEIHGIKTFVELLEHFGHVIYGIQINENLDRNQCVDMSRLINERCSESLVHLNFDGIHFSTFEYFTVPFNKLESLTLSVGRRPFNSSILTMNQLFPKLKNLDFHFCENISYSFIEYNYTNLEHLSLMDFSNAYKPQKAIEDLIRKNSHIRSIKLNGYPGSYARKIKKLLPHIESLELQFIDVANTPFELEHLKQLHVRDTGPICYERLSFPRLESLVLPNPSRNFDGWIEFCRNHNNLSRLHITENLPYISKELVKLTEELPSLIELKIDSDYLNLDTINRLIESHEKLMNMELFARQFAYDVTMDNLRERYGNEWIIEGIVGDSWTSFASRIIFKRRISGNTDL